MKATLSPAGTPLRFTADLARLSGLLIATSLLFSGLLAQTRPTDPVTPVQPINPGGGGNAGGGGIGIGTLPILPGGGGVNIGGGSGGTVTTPTIVAPAGALVGATVTATVVLGQAGTGQTGTSGATYQWSISGGRIITDVRAATIQFVTDAVGVVNLSVSISAAGTSFSPTASVSMVSAESAGAVTAPATIAANATSVAASVPAAQSGDRSFRWAITGGAAISSGQGTNAITFRPTSVGLKQVTCTVNLQNVVSVPITANVVALGTGAPVVVTINGGSGGGTYPAGSLVDIFANPPASGQVFDRWTGTTTVLGNAALAPLIARTAITVPTSAVTLTATYKVAPVWTPTILLNFNPQTQAGANNTTTTSSTTVAYQVPANASALVFLLHATGGSVSEWFDRPNQLLLARELVAAGYGVVALDSVNRTARTWAAPAVLANNPDALNHAAAIDRLVALGAIAAGKPVFFLGNGAGANAAVRYADLLATATPARPVKGAVLFLSAGIDTLAVTSKVPQFFALAANDDALGATGIQDARNFNQILLGRGVATAVVTNTLAPLYASNFRTLGLTSTSFTLDDAQAIWTAIKAAGIIDANNYPKSVPTTAALTAALPAAYRPRVSDIGAEISIAAAEREFFSDADARVINFLNGRVADAPVQAPGRLINLSTRSSIAYLGDSLALGFAISGTAKATLMIRGIGPALRGFGLSDALAAPRLEVNRGTTVIASNEGWDKPGNPATAAQIATAAASVGAFALAPGAFDAAVLVQLDPGTYTANITGLGGAIGDVLAEIYDISRNGTRLTNLSTLSRINNEGDLLIPGIVISGNNPRTLVIRAVAQGLRDFGYGADAVLGDARIVILSGAQTVNTNNNWAQAGTTLLSAAFPAVGAFPLRNASDAALLDALTPGSYTLQAGATPISATVPAGTVVPNQTGSVLVEVYEVP
jgi:hypothetical protein